MNKEKTKKLVERLSQQVASINACAEPVRGLGIM